MNEKLQKIIKRKNKYNCVKLILGNSEYAKSFNTNINLKNFEYLIEKLKSINFHKNISYNDLEIFYLEDNSNILLKNKKKYIFVKSQDYLFDLLSDNLIIEISEYYDTVDDTNNIYVKKNNKNMYVVDKKNINEKSILECIKFEYSDFNVEFIKKTYKNCANYQIMIDIKKYKIDELKYFLQHYLFLS